MIFALIFGTNYLVYFCSCELINDKNGYFEFEKKEEQFYGLLKCTNVDFSFFNDLKFIKEAKTLTEFRLNNSTFCMTNICSMKSVYKSIFQINFNSFCCLSSCEIIVYRESNVPIICNGTVCFENISLKTTKDMLCQSVVWANEKSKLIIEKSFFSDLYLTKETNFVHSQSCFKESLKNCMFLNVTRSYPEPRKCQKTTGSIIFTVQNCFVDDSTIFRDGGIMHGELRLNCSIIFNTSFINNKYSQNIEISKEIHKDLTTNQSFSFCEWSNCDASCGGAIFIYDNVDAVILIDNSIFTKCNALSTRGGGIYAENISECIVNNSVFLECVASTKNSDGGGGGVCCMEIRNQVLVENCLFKDDWSGNDGGGIDIWYCSCSRQDHCIKDCLFNNCSGNNNSSSNGGGCDVWFPQTISVCCSCSFCNCFSSVGAGGYSVNASLSNDVMLLKYCFFHNNTALISGHDVVMHLGITNCIDPTCYSTRITLNRVSTKWNSIDDKSEWLINSERKTRYVCSSKTDENAKDTYFCGLDEIHPCETLSHCIKQLVPDYVNDVMVMVGTVVERDEVNAKSSTFTIRGAELERCIVETELNRGDLSLFSVGIGQLNVRDLSVIHRSSLESNRQCQLFEIRSAGLMNVSRVNIRMDDTHSENTSFESSLVVMNGGRLKMDFVVWSKTILTESVVKISGSSGAEAEIMNCSFLNIKRTRAGASLVSSEECFYSMRMEECTVDECGSKTSEFGGGFLVEIKGNNYMEFKGGSIKNCYSSEATGRGGGIGMIIGEGDSDFEISCAFEGNKAKWGSDIFIDFPNLESAARSGKITSLTASNSTINKIRGFDNGDETIPIPLCVYLIPLPNEIAVSNADAFDYSRCGFAEFPCLTLKHSLERQEDEKKIVVDGMTEVKNELAFDSFQHTIRGKDENSGWKVSNDPNGSDGSMITVIAIANLSSLIFSIPSILLNHETFFASSSPLFSIESCSLSFQDSKSALSYVFLSVSAGKVSVSSFVVLSLTIGNCSLICLDGSNVDGTFTSMSIEDICREAKSVLFGVANGASFSIKDSTLSVKASSHAVLSNKSIRVISTNSAKLLKLTNNTISRFKGDEGNGGAVECTLGRDCALEIVGGMMSECESNGGNGGGLWVEMKEGSRFAVGNVTDSYQVNAITSNRSDLFQLASCRATQTADRECGFGGGIYLHLDDGANSFVLKDVSFSECDAREGKEVFINANELSSVVSRTKIGFEVDLNNFAKLNGFERSALNEAFAIPLVVYLWDNFSAPAFVGGGLLSHDFSKCGFEEFPCSSISKAVSIHFEEQKKDVALLEPFSFEEELGLASNEWSIASKVNEMKCDVSDLIQGTQSGLIESSVSVSVTGIVFYLKKFLSFHESVFEVHSVKLILNGCGIEGGAESISTVFVKAVGGVVEVIKFGTKNMKIGDSSFFIVEGSGESVPLMNMTHCDFGEITFNDGCVVECHNGNIEKITGCSFSSVTRSKGSGGCIGVTNENDNNGRDYKVEINDCTFEGCAVEEEGNEIGGGALLCEASSKTNLIINGCSFYCCTAPYEGEAIGYGGGIMMKILREEEVNGRFVISSPVFSSDKQNNAKFGKDLFISSTSLTKSVKNETLPFVKDRLEILTEDSMRGYDGENKECAIPLIYFWKSIETSMHIAEKGYDVVVCGLFEYPCTSVDYGINRIGNSSVGQVTIHDVCDVRSEMSVSGMRLEGTNGETDKIQFVKEIEGDGNAVVECKGVVHFSELGVLIPSAFDNGANILIKAGSDAIKTSISGCSIHTSDNAEDELSFVLISAEKGIVEIEKTEISGFSTMHEIISISPDCVTAMNNVTFEDISLSGKSAIAMRESVISERENDNAEEEWNALFDHCSFVNVKHSASNNPSLLFCDVTNEVRLKMENSTIDRCGSTSSNEGGGVFFLLNERGRLEMNRTNVTNCFCSNTGRGGGLFLKSQSVAQKALSFVLSNITFKGNVASKGRDVFVKCTDLDSQISESQFLINFGEPFAKELAIWGCSADNYEDEEDLLGRVYVFRSEFIFVSSIAENSSDSKNCGEMKGTCSSLNVGMSHIIPSDYSQLYIWNETALRDSCSAQKVTIKSMESWLSANISVCGMDIGNESIISTSESVRFERVQFVFDAMQSVVCSCLMLQLNGSLFLDSVSFVANSESSGNSIAFHDFSILIVEDGAVEAEKCSAWGFVLSKPAFWIQKSEIVVFEDLTVHEMRFTGSMIECALIQKISVSKLVASNITLQSGCVISTDNSPSLAFISLQLSSFENISRSTSGSCIASVTRSTSTFEMRNCSCRKCKSGIKRGSLMSAISVKNLLINSCLFEKSLFEKIDLNKFSSEICRWNGSLVEIASSTAAMKDTSFANSPEGGLSVCGGSTTIEKGEFANNNPSIEGYPSARRNIVCGDAGSLDVLSLKGGDGVLPNTSMWILNEGCTVGGMAEERESVFFIPRLDGVEAEDDGGETTLKFHGSLLLPCNLWFQMATTVGSASSMAAHQFEADGFAGEGEAVGVLPSGAIRSAPEEAEVSVCILFGRIDSPSSTESFVLKNRSESEIKGDGRIVEGGKEGKSSSSTVIIIVLVVILLIVLIASILVTIRWRKQKRRTEELEVIVEDTVKKDPKAFEMVTMEMSPEEQWRKAEREAEKKNEERIKKRVYAKSLGHSESSEHLLSESGSTEYILGRDSDKIPEWMLEKVDEKEEEETRKRTPSPSISSTSTTDSDSTFVRREDLCPTTSSMSNLVDAMACSSPHEKLIVDLRDSLFMLLHGRNEKKEMAIGTFQEREYTAVQILFWVANLALHSFDEMDNPLSSLANLSPHIVLFSEHMVICIAMHSDFSSDDSDSSSISSSTVVTSASDDNDSGSLPSSAFEDEDDYKKECLRWKAPELLINKKMGATKETVAFSIGMILWECLTLKIPFGEYEAEVAGQKIVNGERPKIEAIQKQTLKAIIKGCIAGEAPERYSLSALKREFIQLFPPGAVMLTISDAVDYDEPSAQDQTQYRTGPESQSIVNP